MFWYPKDFNSHDVVAEELQDGTTLLKVTDIEGGKHQFQVETEAYKKWKGGELIQRCFPKLSIVEREIIISGYTDEIWKKIFGKSEV